jgi:CRP-like cAMP-binding protein
MIGSCCRVHPESAGIKEDAMYFSQSDMLWGLDRNFVKAFMAGAVKASYKRGDVIFHEGESADYLYILLKGRVKLSIGENGCSIYTVDHPGEAFGWSSLVDRKTYTASAECRSETTLLKFQAETLLQVLEKDPPNGLEFFKRLSGLLGNRLLQTYKMISVSSQTELDASFGTGQLISAESTAT